MKHWIGPVYLCSLAVMAVVVLAANWPVRSNAADSLSPLLDPIALPTTNQVDQTSLLQTRQMLESLQRELHRDLQREVETLVARHTEAVTSSLAQIEPALNRIREQQVESSATANRTILIA